MFVSQCDAVWCGVLQCVAVCCSVMQCVAVCCGVLVCCSMLQCVAVCCSVLQCVAVYCSVLQYVAVCCSVLQRENESDPCPSRWWRLLRSQCYTPEIHQIENSSIQIQIKAKFQSNFVTWDTEESELLNFVNFGNFAVILWICSIFIGNCHLEDVGPLLDFTI